MTQAPYAGLRVYDATQGVAGPHCTMLLALQGAEVIKVEPPGGDWVRSVGSRIGDHSPHSLAWNRGKRSVVLDLRQPAARAAARRLADSSDVVVENFRPGAMRRLGLDYETLSAARPGLVYCSVSGFGQTGPYSGDAAVDGVMQAFAGWMHVNRDREGRPHALGMVAIDMLTGLYAYGAIAARLVGRFRFGRGGYDDVSMLQAALAFLAPHLVDHTRPAEKPAVLFSPPNGEFSARDGAFVVSVTRQEHFDAICSALGREDLAADARFASRAARIEHRAALLAALEPEIARRSGAELFAAFRAAGALGAPVRDLATLLADPQVAASRVVCMQALEGLGPVPVVHVPGTAHPEVAPAPAPALGADTEPVLASLGYSQAEVAALKAGGAPGRVAA